MRSRATAPDVVAYPMACNPGQMRQLDDAIAGHESALGITIGPTEILPVCKTVLESSMSMQS